MRPSRSWPAVAVFAACLAGQLAWWTRAIARNSDNQAVAAALEPDVGECIEGAMTLPWFSGGAIVYGNGYMAPARLAAALLPLPARGRGRDATEQRVHFCLQWLSLASVFALSALLAWTLLADLPSRLLATTFLVSALVAQETWARYILKAHPDHLLAALSAAFILVLARYLRDRSARAMIAAAAVGAAALSTKLSFLLMLPPLVILELPPFKKASFVRLAKFYLLGAAFFCLFDFPVPFRVRAVAGALLGESAHSNLLPSPATLAAWGLQLGKEAWRPLLVLLAGWLLLAEDSTNPGWAKFRWRLWAFVGLATAQLFARTVLSGYIEQYVLPYAAMLLTMVVLELAARRGGTAEKLRAAGRAFVGHPAGALICAGLLQLSLGLVPAQGPRMLEASLQGREEVREAYAVVEARLQAGRRVLAEQYTPVPRHARGFLFQDHLKTTLSRFMALDPDVVTINASQLPHIMDGPSPDPYYLAGRYNFPELRKYYGLFYNKGGETTDPLGRRWVKIYENAAGMQIWEKQPGKS